MENTLKDQIKALLNRVINSEDEKPEEEEKKEVENENVDKRKLIDEVGGILKGKVDDEVIRTIIGKLEKIGYDKSEDGSADNCGKKAKNADEKEEVKEEVKEEEIKEEKAENKCKNSMDDVRKAVLGGKVEKQTNYIPHSKRIEMGNNY